MKKGFFFSLDAILALMLFGLILAGIYSFFLASHSIDQQFYVSEDVLNLFSTVKINELDLTVYPEIQRMVNEGIINNEDNTLLEQVIAFRETGETDNAQVFIDELVGELIPEQYGFSIDIEGEIYQREI